jgi:hypothetical protein
MCIFSQGNASRLINSTIWQHSQTITFPGLFPAAVSQVWVYTTCLHSTKIKDHIMEGTELMVFDCNKFNFRN